MFVVLQLHIYLLDHELFKSGNIIYWPIKFSLLHLKPNCLCFKSFELLVRYILRCCCTCARWERGVPARCWCFSALVYSLNVRTGWKKMFHKCHMKLLWLSHLNCFSQGSQPMTTLHNMLCTFLAKHIWYLCKKNLK